LLEDKKEEAEYKDSFQEVQGQIEGKLIFSHTVEDEHSNSESSKPPSEEEGNSENESTHSKRMRKME